MSIDIFYVNIVKSIDYKSTSIQYAEKQTSVLKYIAMHLKGIRMMFSEIWMSTSIIPIKFIELTRKLKYSDIAANFPFFRIN